MPKGGVHRGVKSGGVSLTSKAVQRAERRMQVTELFKQNFNYDEIGSKLGIDKATVSRDVNLIVKQWKKHDEEIAESEKILMIAQVEDHMRTCNDRIKELENTPKSGSRWIEEWRKLAEFKADLLGLKKIGIEFKDTSLTKEQKDAIFRARLGIKPGQKISEALIPQLRPNDQTSKSD